MFLYERIIEGFKFLVACPNKSPAPSDAEFDYETWKIGDDTVLTYNTEDSSPIIPLYLRTSQTPKVYTEPTNIDTEFSGDLLGSFPAYVNYNGVIWELEDGDPDSIWVKTSMTIEEADNEWKEVARIKFFYQKLLDIYGNETPNEDHPVQIPTEDDRIIIPMVGEQTLFEWFDNPASPIEEEYVVEFTTNPDIVTTLDITATYNDEQFSSGDSIPKGDSIVFVFTSNSSADVIAKDEDGVELFTVTSKDFTRYEYTPEENISIVFYQDPDHDPE